MPTEPDHTAPTIVEAVDVWKSYGSVDALAGVGLTLRAGEIVTLLGPNGAGKTTLVEIIEGLVRPDRGTVRVLGMDPQRDQRRVRSRIGIVLQNHGVDPRIRVVEAADQFATYFGRPKHEARDAVAQFGLAARARSFVGTLSGGEKRRLDLALAAIGDPEVLFLDEPTASLDVVGRRTVWDAIEALAASGRAILMTSHQFDEAETFSDRVALLVDGRVVLEGPPRALRAGRRRILRARFSRPPTTLPGAGWEMDGRDVAVSCADPLVSLRELVAWAEELDGNLQSLEIDAAPLEDVCVELFSQDGGASGSRGRGHLDRATSEVSTP